jgi:hypothetical protein
MNTSGIDDCSTQAHYISNVNFTVSILSSIIIDLSNATVAKMNEPVHIQKETPCMPAWYVNIAEVNRGRLNAT